MEAPPGHVRAELVSILREDSTRVGDVFRLSSRGLNADQIARELGVKTTGFVSNNRSIAAALLDGAVTQSAGIASHAAGWVRGIMRSRELSPDARRYLETLLAQLDRVATASVEAKNASRSAPARSPRQPPRAGSPSLRASVDAAIRERVERLVQAIKAETGIDAEDYYSVVVSASPLDAMARVVSRVTATATTHSLHEARRVDLTIEQGVIHWSVDLPLQHDLVEFARGRVAYLRKQ